MPYLILLVLGIGPWVGFSNAAFSTSTASTSKINDQCAKAKMPKAPLPLTVGCGWIWKRIESERNGFRDEERLENVGMAGAG